MKHVQEMIHWVFALGTAFCIYLLLIFLFSSIELKQPVQRRAEQHKIILLPFDGKLTSSEKELTSWMHENNPTLIVKPNREYNYSRVLANDFNFKLMFSELPQERSFDFFNDDNLFSRIKINQIALEKPFDFDRLISNYEIFSHPILPEKVFKLSENKIKFPCFRNFYTGEIYPYKFPSNVKIQDLLSRYSSIGNTIVKVDVPANMAAFPRVILQRSCGIKKLDKLAADNIITQTPGIMYKKYSGQGIKLVVLWK